MLQPVVHTLINPQNGNLAFQLLYFSDNQAFEQIQRHNYFSLIWVLAGEGQLKADFADYAIENNSLFAFAPYQPFMFSTSSVMKGIAIFFHPEFFCIHKHQEEIALNGVLFNNIYQPPYVHVDEPAHKTFQILTEQIKTEMGNPALAQYELLVSYLKIFLITASRLKILQQPATKLGLKDSKEPYILQKLKDAIEENFKSKHAPVEYAAKLFITPKALAKITSRHYHKTVSSLINDRIIIEAKRELYLTNKTVKQIADELGYADEFYFSRFFKKNAGVSPQLYRDKVGFGKMIEP